MKVFPTENTNELTNFSTIAEKLTGQVKSRTKGYGFITRKDSNEDIFVPFNGVKKLEKSLWSIYVEKGYRNGLF